MTASVFLLVIGIVLVFVWGYAIGGRLPLGYRSRSCQGRRWRKAFPVATKQEIRAFLTFFISAFAFDEKEKLKLAPTDEILKIYRAQYPSRFTPDAMELEILAEDLEREHGLKLGALWNDRLTLGELFEHVQQNSVAAK